MCTETSAEANPIHIKPSQKRMGKGKMYIPFYESISQNANTNIKAERWGLHYCTAAGKDYTEMVINIEP
jgi:hypothetical protein